jgi:hypothetical protein
MYAESKFPQSKKSDYAWHHPYASVDSRKEIANPSHEEALHCANCDIEILWSPTIVAGKPFCCTGCAAGGPCNCDYSQYSSVKISGVIHYTFDVGAGLDESIHAFPPAQTDHTGSNATQPE